MLGCVPVQHAAWVLRPAPVGRLPGHLMAGMGSVRSLSNQSILWCSCLVSSVGSLLSPPTSLRMGIPPPWAAFLSFLLLLLWQLSARSWLWSVLFLWSQLSCLNGSFSTFTHPGKSCWPQWSEVCCKGSPSRDTIRCLHAGEWINPRFSLFSLASQSSDNRWEGNTFILQESSLLHLLELWLELTFLNACLETFLFSCKSLEPLWQLCRKEIWRQPKCTQRFSGTCWKYGPCSHNPVCQTGWITAPNALSLLCSKWLYSGSHWWCWLKFL